MCVWLCHGRCVNDSENKEKSRHITQHVEHFKRSVSTETGHFTCSRATNRQGIGAIYHIRCRQPRLYNWPLTNNFENVFIRNGIWRSHNNASILLCCTFVPHVEAEPLLQDGSALTRRRGTRISRVRVYCICILQLCLRLNLCLSFTRARPCGVHVSWCRIRSTLARSYHEDARLDGSDQEKLRMLESYLASARSREAAELEVASEAPIPTRVEDVDRFMAELVRAETARHAALYRTHTHFAHCCVAGGSSRPRYPPAHSSDGHEHNPTRGFDHFILGRYQGVCGHCLINVDDRLLDITPSMRPILSHLQGSLAHTRFFCRRMLRQCGCTTVSARIGTNAAGWVRD